MKRKLKKKYRILFILIILVIVVFLFLLNNKDKKNNETSTKTNNTIDYVSIISEKIDIDSNFIKWIDNNYKDSLKKLNGLLDNKEYDKNMWHEVTGYSYLVLNDLYNNKYSNMDNVKIIESNSPSTLSFTGDISLAEDMRVIKKYYSNNNINSILSEDMLNIMKDSDLLTINSEFTFSNRGSKLNGKLYTLRAKPENIKIFKEIGVDLVTLANNHVYDYGKDAFFDTLDTFDNNGITRVGAGHNLDEAMKPQYFIINGYKIGIVNASRAEKYRFTPGATNNSEGIFLCYDSENVLNLIKEIRNETDYIIAIYHYGKENYHELEEEQILLSRKSIDQGADVVVGHHAHTLQGVEMYNSKPIIYNLGNFLFNQNEIETALFKIILNDNGTMDYYMIPALQNNGYTDVLNGERKQKVINDINSWSINALIDENGKINIK